MAGTQVVDVIKPERYARYSQLLTEEKTEVLQSGAMVRDPRLDAFLAVGGGVTFNMPAWKDLTRSRSKIVTDELIGVNDIAPDKIAAIKELAVRLSRAMAWSDTDLAAALAGDDPMDAITQLTSGYWAADLQAHFIATWAGVFADNAAAPTGTEHVQNDLIHDVKGSSFSDDVTNFTGKNLIGATLKMGDSMKKLRLIMVHSVVFATMQIKNLIDFIPDARGETDIATYQGKRVIVDDHMPSPSSGIYESWIFGEGATAFGVGRPRVPVETKRYPEAGQGGGQEALFERYEWVIHPRGHRYAGTPADGGPSTLTTANNLAHADSWVRAVPERKMIAAVKLVTREF